MKALVPALAMLPLAACDGYYGGTVDEITFDRALGREEVVRQASVSGPAGAISAIAFAREGAGLGGDVESFYAMATIRDAAGTGPALGGSATYDGAWAVAGWQEREAFADSGTITLTADFSRETLTGVGTNGLTGEAQGRLVVDGIFLGTAVGGEVTYLSGRFDAAMSGFVDSPLGAAYAVSSGLPATPSAIGEDGVVLVFAGDRSDGGTPWAVAGGVVGEAVAP